MKRIIAILLCCAVGFGLFGCGRNTDSYTPTGDGLTWDEDYTGEATRATVDGSGTVTGVSKGQTTVTVSVGSLKAECIIRVIAR